MNHRRVIAASTAAFATLFMSQALPAQQAPETGPKVGDVAPDFALPGATRYGMLRDQVRLSDYKGQTVVLAFFFKARTRG